MTTLRSRPGVRPGWAAFGLIGLLIVMAIVLYLMFGAGGGGGANGGGGGGYMGQIGQSRQTGKELAVNINTRDLLTMIANHQMQYDELPRSVADLEAAPGSFTDPWGTQLAFSYEDERAQPAIVIITSAGPDGEFDTDDDVVSKERLPF